MNDAVDSADIEEVKQEAKAMSITGWACVVFGVLAIAFPFAAGTGVAIVVGITLLLAGISGVMNGWKLRQRDGWAPVVMGALTAVAGLLFLGEPWFGLKLLTMILIVYFVVAGIMTLMAAFAIRPEQGWGWHAFDGAVSLVLGIMLFTQYPKAALWLIGVLVGVRMLMMGMVMIATGGAVRDVAKQAEATS